MIWWGRDGKWKDVLGRNLMWVSGMSMMWCTRDMLGSWGVGKGCPVAWRV